MIRPEIDPASEREGGRRRVLVVTGSRAEYGLLVPVMEAIKARAELELAVVAAGSHLMQPALTVREVKAAYKEHLVDLVPMQTPGRTERDDDVESLARGIARIGRVLRAFTPDWTLVLGDRIEAFAAACAASVSGRALAHIHGGDRAEGVADEAMRHAITKLAHLHLAASEQSAERIRRMGERPAHVFNVGSPAIDAIGGFGPLDDERWSELGRPAIVVLMHPVGRSNEQEEAGMTEVLEAARAAAREARAGGGPGGSGVDGGVLVLEPNHDPGRAGIMRAIDHAAREPGLIARAHVPRPQFIGLLRRLASVGGVLVGNSSAALIEASAIPVAAVDVGPRQSGRERAANVVDAGSERAGAIGEAIRVARRLDLSRVAHPYGSGASGARIAELLALTNPHDPRLLRKHNTY